MDPGATPHAIYTARLADRKVTLATLTRRRDNIGTLRLLVFLWAAAMLWTVIKGPLSFWSLAAPLVVFIGFIVWQSRVQRAMEAAGRAIQFYQQGLARLENRWHGNLVSNGERFLDRGHPYAVDLDLFGHASLFELLCTARTAGGEARLGHWLQRPAAIPELHARQAAVSELRPMLDLREHMAVLGAEAATAGDAARILGWASAAPRPFPPALRIASFVLSCITAPLLLAWVGTGSHDLFIALLVVGFIEALIGGPLRPRVISIASAVAEPARYLDLYANLLAILESHEFQSPRLAALRSHIRVEGQPASRRLAHLRRLMDMLDSRENPIVRAVGPLVLWTTQIAMAFEHWRAQNGRWIASWLDAISEMEALSSLAGYAFEHAEEPFPEFIEGQALFDGRDLGHPLLPADTCVRNSICLRPPLRLLVVSGSNMSGKSTLLRTVGVNAVLALAGAPVRASRLTIAPTSLGASIYTVDSLEEGQSRFMTEILRLKQILDLTPPALFLLDELLGGTNSHDRAIGAEGLVRALLDRGAIGLLTTHDLSLARIADELGLAAANVHFEDRLEDGKLVFDYTMRPGTVTRSNALDLMRAVGLDV